MDEKEEKNERGTSLMMMMRPPPPPPTPETELFLRWGNRKRLRCVRIRSNNNSITSPPNHHLSSSDLSSTTTRIRRKISSRFLSVSSHDEKQLSFPQPPSRLTRNSAEPAVAVRFESSRRGSPEKEERWYTTRGSVGNLEENGKVHHQLVDGHDGAAGNHQVVDDRYVMNGHSNRGGGVVWPKLCISLTSKEKEEDFMAMKGCKLPQRPKKRAKLIQKTLLFVSPGAWLTDMSLERYEVREKKISKKRPRGLKAMGNVESDSEPWMMGRPGLALAPRTVVAVRWNEGADMYIYAYFVGSNSRMGNVRAGKLFDNAYLESETVKPRKLYGVVGTG
ncbi:hypothetical protein ACH5RR_007543 [Cinchona calisaya]|uniref:Uncharacterized protein n=1 Tax=Cinchona calisaya TaxID=153742 RepID=A0ABD3AS22_9GENT